MFRNYKSETYLVTPNVLDTHNLILGKVLYSFRLIHSIYLIRVLFGSDIKSLSFLMIFNLYSTGWRYRSIKMLYLRHRSIETWWERLMGSTIYPKVPLTVNWPVTVNHHHQSILPNFQLSVSHKYYVVSKDIFETRIWSIIMVY